MHVADSATCTRNSILVPVKWGQALLPLQANKKSQSDRTTGKQVKQDMKQTRHAGIALNASDQHVTLRHEFYLFFAGLLIFLNLD